MHYIFKIKVLIGIIFLFFFALNCFAKPLISTNFDDFIVKEGDALVVEGTNFESGDSKPIIWDNFERGISGNLVINPVDGNWTPGDSKYSNEFKHSGEMCSKSIVTANNGNTTSGFRVNIPHDQKFYVSYWFRYTSPDDKTGQAKLFTMKSHTESENIAWAPSVFAGGAAGDANWCSMYYQLKSLSQIKYFSNVEKSKWHLFEGMFKQSTSGNSPDGKIQMKIDGTMIMDEENIITRINDDDWWDEIDVFYGMTNFSTITNAYIDDVYINNSWARVEIGDKANYDQCTHREIQIPTQWASNGTSIKINVNQGSFPDRSTVYLFVVDENGNASDGSKIIFGETVGSPEEETTLCGPQQTKTFGDSFDADFSGKCQDTYLNANAINYSSNSEVLLHSHLCAGAISNITGSLQDKGSITVTGSGFGANGPTVEIFDAFDGAGKINGDSIDLSGTNGPRYGSYGDSSYHGTSPIVYDNRESLSGDYSALVHVDGGTERNVHGYFSENTTAIFVSYWLKIPSGTRFPQAENIDSFPAVSAWKHFWFGNSDPIAQSPTDAITFSQVGSVQYSLGGNSYNPSPIFKVTGNWWEWGGWMRMSFTSIADQNNPDTTNGYKAFQGLGNGNQFNVTKTDSPVFNTATNTYWDRYQFMGWSGDAGEETSNCRPVIDDFYVATGPHCRARVEIGNNITYGDCTILSIATPVLWKPDGTQVQAVLNQGPYAAGETAYAFVIDSNGIPSDQDTETIGYQGFPLTFADESGNASPTIMNGSVNASANRIAMKWDLSAIPQGSTIQEATLSLYMDGHSGSGGGDSYELAVHKIIHNSVDISKCTWNTYDGINNWTGGANGGEQDMYSAESSTIIDKTKGYKDWAITQMVQDWVNNPSGNFGLMINSDTAAASDSNRFFRPSEYSDPEKRPKLIIKYCGGSIVVVPIAPTDVSIGNK